ncbi:DUF6242 domain-containing protein [Parabacteroides chinchillae]|uniref:BNR repeat-like domain-containing protein n=1 Tax=Parabacteroides chinchillae TaxID=871327 RepID=A0A8G2BUL6_9BACT|nr:DUF6242 domain-containing protein [Parabacteroides chinchillae]SEF58636.1 hypothetical protein SAMN05444001_10319 [Parabacteroides chinchillae]
MKNKIILFLAGCLVLLMNSCLGSDDVEYTIPKNCQITSFTLKNDSVPELSKVDFTIDQLDGRIFNIDSMAYGTEIEKVVCTVNFASGTAQVQVIQEAVGDTIPWNGTDSLDFSKPVKFITYSYDGQFSKTYLAQVNIHQVVPDSMVWSLYADKVTGLSIDEEKVVAFNVNSSDYYYMYVKPATDKSYKLYRSAASDAKKWDELSLSGLPDNEVRLSQITEYEGVLYAPGTKGVVYQSVDGQNWSVLDNTPVVKYLLGGVKEGGVSQPSALATIIDKDGTLKFAAMDKSQNWTEGNIVPVNFPVTGFGSATHNIMYKERLTVACGRTSNGQLSNTVWATMNATSWAILSDEGTDVLVPSEGTMLSRYDDKFFLIGGIDAAGKPSKTIYNSIDNGVTWSEIDSMVVLPESYKARGFSSVLVDKEKYMLIFGGKTSNNSKVLDEIWRGRINRLGFKD